MNSSVLHLVYEHATLPRHRVQGLRLAVQHSMIFFWHLQLRELWILDLPDQSLVLLGSKLASNGIHARLNYFALLV